MSNDSEKQSYGSFRLRAIGGRSLSDAKLFRSCELGAITEQEASALVHEFGIEVIYDMRNKKESAASPEPYIVGIKSMTIRPSEEQRRSNVSERLRAGVITEYGAPEQRMIRNYRRYAQDNFPFGRVLRMLAHEPCPSLIHCVNGKDRTGVLSAVIMRVAGAHADDIMTDYLLTNQVNAESIAREVEALGQGMNDEELAILLSFLEARPAYLDAFFDEIDQLHGSFENYLKNELKLDAPLQERIGMLIG